MINLLAENSHDHSSEKKGYHIICCLLHDGLLKLKNATKSTENISCDKRIQQLWSFHENYLTLKAPAKII